MKLITTQNAKTIKGEKYGWLTGVLYLAPGTIAKTGHNVCSNADNGCRASCLYTAGHGIFSNVQKGRIRKTKLLFKDRQLFIAKLCQDIDGLKRRAQRMNMRLTIRLNGTSDIPWYRPEFGDIPSRYPDVQFYDYTRDPRRVASVKRDNYYLILSKGVANDTACRRNLKSGRNVAVVFESLPLPATHWGYTVILGDESDLRFLDPSPYVVGLTAKGRARRDTSGFVVRAA